MAKGTKDYGSLDKPSSVSKGSMKMTTHVNSKATTKGLDMTKSHPLHTGKTVKNNYSAYDAN